MVVQDGECIDSSDCKCQFEGEILESGTSWNETARCETCECMDGGIIECSPKACPACPIGEVPVSFEGIFCGPVDRPFPPPPPPPPLSAGVRF